MLTFFHVNDRGRDKTQVTIMLFIKGYQLIRMISITARQQIYEGIFFIG